MQEKKNIFFLLLSVTEALYVQTETQHKCSRGFKWWLSL